MARYQIWDKESDIYTLTGEKLTPAEWMARYPWADIEGAKMIIGGGRINGTVAMELEATVEMYQRMGAAIDPQTMTDQELLAAIEEYEDHPPRDETPSAQERIAAALEFQVLVSLPDEV